MSNPYDTGQHKKTSVLGPTLKFKGKLSANEDLLIQGQIEGSISHTSNLTIGEEGKLKADVKAEYIEVEGTVDGDLTGSKSVVVKESANVTGNIYSPTVTLREGSTFNGQIDMSGKERPETETTPKSATQTRASSAARKSEEKPAERPAREADKKAVPEKKRSSNVA